MTLATTVDSPLLRMARMGQTEYWNDSCDPAELKYAIERGAVGATSNPVIVLDVFSREKAHWAPRVRELAAAHPGWTEVELSWAIAEELVVRGAALLAGIHDATAGCRGWQSFQVNPADYPAADRMVEQAVRFTSLAANIQVKFPATAAGIIALEEATAHGVNVNATVSFSVAQAIAAAEAIERGLARLAAAGGDPAKLAPIVVIMIGRLDDWLKVVADRDLLSVTPGALDRAGIAAFKRSYAIFRERGYRSRLLAAAYRHHLHWTELVGGDVSLTIPHAWQVRFNQSGSSRSPAWTCPLNPRSSRNWAGSPTSAAPTSRTAWCPSSSTGSAPRHAPCAVSSRPSTISWGLSGTSRYPTRTPDPAFLDESGAARLWAP
jgi:transaldolase